MKWCVPPMRPNSRTLIGLWRDCSRSFCRARRANVALIFGLAAVPLLGMVGAAIDFSLASSAKTQLDAALDSATLLATTSASNAIANGSSADAAIAAAQTLATQRFTAQVAALSSATVTSVAAKVSISAGSFNARVQYTANYPTAISELFGVGSIPLQGSSGTTLSTDPYADIHILLDVSGSMTIGATQPDMDALQALSRGYVPPGPLPGNVDAGDGCAFACHWTTAYPDYYALATKNGITLRIDLLRSALTNLVNTLTAQNSQGVFRLALYTFNAATNTVFPLSGNVSNAASAMPLVAVGVNDCTNGPSPCAETNFDDAVVNVTKLAGTAGTGASQAAARKYLIIITDGVVDEYAASGPAHYAGNSGALIENPGGTRYLFAADSGVCQQAKANGVTVMVLWTPYVPLDTPYVPVSNGFYDGYVAPFYGSIWPNLQACASSPSLAWQASDSADINAALQQILAVATKSPGHFTQ